MSTHPKSVAISNLGGGGGGAAAAYSDWTEAPGVIGRGTGTPFDADDYVDAYAISGLGTATSINTLGSGEILRTTLNGSYGGRRLENVGAVDFMVAARLRLFDLRTAALGNATAATNMVTGLAITNDQATLASWEMGGFGQNGASLQTGDLLQLYNPAWASWALRRKVDIPMIGEVDIAITQISGLFRWWAGIHGSWHTIYSQARVATAGAIMLRLQGLTGSPIAAELVNYAPVGTFAASNTVPPSLAVDA